MTDHFEPAPQRSIAIALGVATALLLGGVCLAAGLWNPTAGLPLAGIFLISAYGIYHHHSWSAYGAALLLAALAAASFTLLARAGGPAIPAAGIVLDLVILGAAIFALYRAGARMPVGSAPGPRSAWIALAVLTFVFPQFCRAYMIASSSMADTLLTGDQVLVLPLSKPPARGEIVQLRYAADRSQMFLKRVVAVGGDRLRIRNKQLIVNGTPVNEPYATHRTGFTYDFRDNFPAPATINLPLPWAEQLRARTVNGELVIPAGKFFVLGDNRDESLDSRYFGFLDQSDLAGHPVLVYFSSVKTDPPTNSPVLLHPSRIRWDRIFKAL
uniref:Signal peptidase I n=1 Tax=Solibacter usitatus (strain Ellin6076) TaxID=234267 RepID=Q029W1_SOLUE